MSTPTATNQTAPHTDANQATNHQFLRASANTAFGPSYYLPAPVASALKGGAIGTAYSETITAVNGTSPYTFAITSGSLPAGLSMSSGGVITGTPTTAATSTFTVTVTDANSYTGSQSFSITIAAAASGGGGSYTFIS